ncbi:MAG: tetratricopeptide repeat protein [Gelidibacter sp.]|nr:tetratricopeptide repeat protein [Gelidibacter sp.]
MKQLIYLYTFLISSVVFAQNETLFEQGNALYNDGNYEEAIKKYDAIIDNGQHSAELYFNLGNAHYKLNHVAPSIYYYEKALQLSPNDKEIKNNIAFARNMTIDAIDVQQEVGFSKLIKNATNTFSFDMWAKIAVGMIVLFVILFIAYYFTHSTGKKRLSFIGSILSLVIACAALTFAFHKYNLNKHDRPAIVFAQESKVKSEPNLRSGEAFTLHEGTKVQILDTMNSWKKIKLSDGKIGWIPEKDIKMLNNF